MIQPRPYVICRGPNADPRHEPVDLLAKRGFPLFAEPCILTRFRSSGNTQFLPVDLIINCPDLNTIPNGY